MLNLASKMGSNLRADGSVQDLGTPDPMGEGLSGKSGRVCVFLCHASEDKPQVRRVYERLRVEQALDPWLDEERLLPGQDWRMEIERALEDARAVVVFLSSRAVSKEGFVQRELRFALDVALEKPEGQIFLIPIRLDECSLPRALRHHHCVDFFPDERWEPAYARLVEAIRRSGKRSGIQHAGAQRATEAQLAERVPEAPGALQEWVGPVALERVFPPFDRNRFEIWALPNPLILHMVLNPGIAFNEVVLGQRLPKVTLIDKTIDAPVLERQFVPCPHCGSLHPSATWDRKVGNWFGLACPTCGKAIPCLWNVTSLLLLFVLSPLWVFVYPTQKKAWLAKETQRLRARLAAGKATEEAPDSPYTTMGMGFGGLMLWMGGLALLLTNSFSWDKAWLLLVLSVIGGAVFGTLMKLAVGRRPRPKGRV